MAWCVKDSHLYAGLFDYIGLIDGEIDGSCGKVPACHNRQIAFWVRQYFCVELVNVNLYLWPVAPQCRQTGNMVDVAVSQKHAERIQFLLIEEFEQITGFEAGIDNQAVLSGIIFTQKISVGLILAQNQIVYFHLTASLKSGQVNKNGI